MDTPLISVTIPTRNRHRYVVEAIESVFAQDYPAVELIVVDDGSTDGTRGVVEAFAPRLRYIHQEHGGIGRARNVGVGAATGNFLAFLDDDDIWLPSKLSVQMAAIRRDPSLDGVYAHTEQFVSPEIDRAYARRFPNLDRIRPAPLASTMLIRRAAFERVGPFSEALQIAVDMDWYARQRDCGLNIAMLDDVVYRRRIHLSNINLESSQSERLVLLKTLLDRRRAAAR